MSGPTQTLLLQSQKMLASTVQFSTYNQTPVTRPHQTRTPHGEHSGMRYRPALPEKKRPSPRRGTARSLRTQQRAYGRGAFRLPVPTSEEAVLGEPAWRHGRTGQRSTHELDIGHSPISMLLRKEVIQPHLPVRLPCYDFVPIADPTFDGSLPRVGPPASGVTDFRDVTGGVYKARERIHRSVADLRLLATPTSRGRVADPDPN